MQRFVPFLLVAPLLLGLLAFAIYPLVYLLVLSASKSLLGKPFQAWIGGDNYLAGLRDSAFLWSLFRSVGYALPSTVIQLITPDEFLGRVLSVGQVIFGGGPSAGQVLSGTLMSLVGAPAAIHIGAIVTVIGAVAVAARLPATWRYEDGKSTS